MCGRLNVTDSPGVNALCDQLEIALWPQIGMRYSRFIRPTEQVSIVMKQGRQHNMVNAIWWLLLEREGHRFKPSRYTSFNTRYDKLNKPGTAGYQAFRQQRCIIPAGGFGETITVNGKKYYHDLLVANDEALAMGGLYRMWTGKDELGRTFTEYSCSIVTLPPHDKLGHVHKKASPLMLSLKDGSLQSWLDPSVSTDVLTDLLVPKIRQELTALPVDSPSGYNQINSSFSITSDV
ncbi:SOS response-associated peptidase family protein [Salinimonas chungwhensis]|uniref:SOS response-associated peptidase family protein n=1 Tax=Salinimonas chungwhensis TaxID=265425 RepID=UPI0003709331|nr:SOS response-associated peptidase family protein [Salinimonas chungwhensis]